MTFLLPKQQHQSTEGVYLHTDMHKISISQYLLTIILIPYRNPKIDIILSLLYMTNIVCILLILNLLFLSNAKMSALFVLCRCYISWRRAYTWCYWCCTQSEENGRPTSFVIEDYCFILFLFRVVIADWINASAVHAYVWYCDWWCTVAVCPVDILFW